MIESFDFRLMEMESDWKHDVEATIAMKDAKATMIQMERERDIQEVSLRLLLPT